MEYGNLTKADFFNGKNSADKAEDFIDEVLTLKGMFTFEDEVVNKETGEVNKATLVCLVTGDDVCISSPSKTLVDSCCKLGEVFGEEVEGLRVKITAPKSNAGRTFYRITLVSLVN